MEGQTGCPKRYYQHYLITVLIAAYLVFSSGVTSAAEMPVSSPYGWRIHPITGEYKFHAGVDLAYDYGAGVPALFDGMIIQAGDYTDGYGYQVLIYHQATDTYTICPSKQFFCGPGTNSITGRINRHSRLYRQFYRPSFTPRIYRSGWGRGISVR